VVKLGPASISEHRVYELSYREIKLNDNGTYKLLEVTLTKEKDNQTAAALNITD